LRGGREGTAAQLEDAGLAPQRRRPERLIEDFIAEVEKRRGQL